MDERYDVGPSLRFGWRVLRGTVAIGVATGLVLPEGVGEYCAGCLGVLWTMWCGASE